MRRFDKVDGDLARIERRLDTGLTDVTGRANASLNEAKQSMATGLAEIKQSISRLETRTDANIAEVKQSIVRLEGKFESSFKWLMSGIASAALASVLTWISVMFGK